MFDEDDQVGDSNGLPDELPENPNPVLKDFYDYYKTPRGWHSRSVNSTGAWESTTPQSFLAFPQYAHIEEMITPVLAVTGEKAHSRYFSEQAHERVKSAKEIIVVPDATHVDLYDKKDKIPFEAISEFFHKNLK